MTRLITFLLCCLCPAMMVMSITINAHSNSFYVDYVGGSDANNGTSTSTPWQHCPGDPAATSTPASQHINSGDFILFNRGVTYLFTDGSTPHLGIQTTNGVTYADYGTGTRPKFTDNYTANGSAGRVAFNAAAAVNQNMSNVVIANFEIGPIGGTNNLVDLGVPVPPSAGVGVGASGMVNTIISNCYFHDLGYWQNAKPMGGTNGGTQSLQGEGIESTSSSNLNITNCEFTKIVYPVQLTGNIYNLDLSGYWHGPMVWGVQICPTAQCVRSNINIHNFLFYNFDTYYDGWTGYGGGPHQDGIFSFADSVLNPGNGGNPTNTWVTTDFNIFDGQFFNDDNAAGGQADIWFLDDNGYINIYNVTFNNGSPNNPITITAATNQPGELLIANCTFDEGSTSGPDWGGYVAAGGDSGHTTWPHSPSYTINMVNTIFANSYNTTYTGKLWTLSTVNSGNNPFWTFNYNAYFQSGSVTTNTGICANGAQSFASMQATSDAPGGGWELQGKFLLTSPFLGEVTNNLIPVSGSAVFGSGSNLTSLALPGITSDILGNARPATGPWTIGAYQSAFVAPSVTTLSGHLTLGGNMTIR